MGFGHVFALVADSAERRDQIERLPEAAAKKPFPSTPSIASMESPRPGSRVNSSADLPAWPEVGVDIEKPRRQLGPLLGPLRQASIKTLIVAPQATESPGGSEGGLASHRPGFVSFTAETPPVGSRPGLPDLNSMQIRNLHG